MEFARHGLFRAKRLEEGYQIGHQQIPTGPRPITREVPDGPRG